MATYGDGVNDCEKAMGIRFRIAKLKEEITSLEREIEARKRKIREIQKECPHPRSTAAPGPGRTEFYCDFCDGEVTIKAQN